MGEKRVVRVLLVEDNAADVRILKEALAGIQAPHELTVVEEGGEALAYLRSEGKFQHAARPDLVFLDLNLPGKSGLEVLAEIKSDPNLRTIPVIVLSSSRAETDMRSSYD